MVCVGSSLLNWDKKVIDSSDFILTGSRGSVESLVFSVSALYIIDEYIDEMQEKP